VEGRLAGVISEYLGEPYICFVETDLVDVYPGLVEELFDFHSHVLSHRCLCCVRVMSVCVA